MQRKYVCSALSGLTILVAVFGTLLIASRLLAAETGDDNPTGVSGIYNGNVTSGGSYDPYTGNAHRAIDDIVVPGAAGSYPLKWTRYWNCRGQTPHTGGKWNYSYIGYGFATVSPPTPNQQGGEPPDPHIQYLALFPDGRSLNYTDQDPYGVEDRVSGNEVRLADGGRVVMGGPGGPNVQCAQITTTASQIIDPYGHVTTIVTTGTGSSKTTKITQPAPGGRYLLVSYNTDGSVSGVQAFDGVNPQPTQWVTYQGSPVGQVNYSDGSSATYTYRDVQFNDWPSGDPNYNPPDVHSFAVASCRDVRYAGPMRDISYQYYEKASGIFRPRMVSENHLLANGLTGELVSSVTGANQIDTTPIETRGDGAHRSFTYHTGGPLTALRALNGKLMEYTDFYANSTDAHTTSLAYETDYTKPSAGFITAVTDANNHTTTYTRSSFSWGITKIAHPPTPSEPAGSFIQQEFTDEANPYFLKSRTDENGKKTSYTRNDPASPTNPNAITKKDYPDGSFETFAYNDFGQITTHRMKNGAYQYFDYDSRGLLVAKWSPTWNATKLSSDPQTTYTYYTASDYGGAWTDRVKTETDPRGNVTQYDYDRAYDGNGENSGAPSGSPVAGRGLVTKVTHVSDNNSYQSFGYDKYGNKVWEENELRQRTSYTYDDYNRVLTVKTPLPSNQIATTTNTYELTDGASSYLHNTKSIHTTTTPTGVVAKNSYDLNFRKKTAAVLDGTSNPPTTLFAYDNLGNEKVVTDPKGNPTTTDYDERNRKWKVTDALSHQTIFGYDPASNITSITRPDGTVEIKTYDEMHRVLTDTVPKDGTPQNVTETVLTQFQYYSGTAATMAGELWHVIDGKTQTSTFEYDPSGLKTKMTYPNNTDYQSWTYDPDKNLIARRTVNGVSQLFSYDARNRPFAMTWSNAADWSAFGYDVAGRMTSAQNPTSTITRQYDEGGRLTLDRQMLQIVPLTAVSRKVHGSAGTFDIALPLTGTAGVECRSGGPTQLVIAFPRAVTLSGASVTSGTGSVSGSPNVSTDGKQVTINLTGVANAQTIIVTLAGVTDGAVTNNVNIGVGVLFCDVNGDGYALSGDYNQVRAQSGQPVTTSNFRDDVNADGYILSGDYTVARGQSGNNLPAFPPLTQPLPASPSIDVQYSYDNDGKDKDVYVTSANYGVTYGYDNMGRFQTISDRGTGALEFQYGYDAASNEVSRTNQLTHVTQDYGTPDALNRMTQRDVKLSNGNVISHEGYFYDDSLRPGLLTRVEREDGKHDTFGYDLLPELTSAQYGLPSSGGTAQRTCNYTFDKAGNRSSMTDSAGPSYTYGTTSLNQYWTDGANPIGNGTEHELSSYQNVSYSYINDTHLSSISGTDLSGQQSAYQLYYDALGRCAVRILNGSTTYYIYDGEKPILEYQSWSGPSAANIYGKSIDEILIRTDYTASSVRTLYYQDDHEGSVTHLMMLVNNTATVIESYRYDAFGKPTITNTSGIVTNNRFMFTGREYMANFGIYEYRNRAYHPGLGRFMSEDPKLFDAGDNNFFRYCANDPLDRTDPMGLQTLPDNEEKPTPTPDLGQNDHVAWVSRSPTKGPIQAEPRSAQVSGQLGRPPSPSSTKAGTTDPAQVSTVTREPVGPVTWREPQEGYNFQPELELKYTFRDSSKKLIGSGVTIGEKPTVINPKDNPAHDYHLKDTSPQRTVRGTMNDRISVPFISAHGEATVRHYLLLENGMRAGPLDTTLRANGSYDLHNTYSATFGYH